MTAVVSDARLAQPPCACAVLVIPPAREGEGDMYCLHVGKGTPPTLSLIHGLCSVAGHVMEADSQDDDLPAGTFACMHVCGVISCLSAVLVLCCL